MTSTLAITINVLLDIAIVGLLALVMTRAARLTPHGSKAVPIPVPIPAPERPRTAPRRPPRASERGRRLNPVLD